MINKKDFELNFEKTEFSISLNKIEETFELLQKTRDKSHYEKLVIQLNEIGLEIGNKKQEIINILMQEIVLNTGIFLENVIKILEKDFPKESTLGDKIISVSRQMESIVNGSLKPEEKFKKLVSLSGLIINIKVSPDLLININQTIIDYKSNVNEVKMKLEFVKKYFKNKKKEVNKLMAKIGSFFDGLKVESLRTKLDSNYTSNT